MTDLYEDVNHADDAHGNLRNSLLYIFFWDTWCCKLSPLPPYPSLDGAVRHQAVDGYEDGPCSRCEAQGQAHGRAKGHLCVSMVFIWCSLRLR